MKIAIVEDDNLWIRTECEILNSFLEKQGITPEYSYFSGSAELLRAEDERFDLAFLDIELAGENGIDSARELNARQKHCQIVFVTNYLNYATDVYETEHVYFVLKDQFEARLPEIFQKIAKRCDMGSALIPLRMIRGGEIVLPAQEILWLERHLRKTIVKTTQGDLEISDKLDGLLEGLPHPLFLRCHNSYIVSLSHVRIMHPTDFQMEGGETIPISRQYQNRVKTQFLEWSALLS